MKKLGVDNYVNTGGFNRLAGRPTTPGCWQPERSSRHWRMFLVLIGSAFVLTGLFFMVF
ncbi:MAG: hypothetical protein IKA71_00120 [Lentisphaeria bacterium]|nr:hypothetical protein [Lentisphaeria bacterium]